MDKSQVTVDELEFNFQFGISRIIQGHFLSKTDYALAIGSQGGEFKIVAFNSLSEEWEVARDFDLQENGAIWYMEAADLTHNGLDEIIIGGMKGAIVCLTGEGDEIWNPNPIAHQCQSAISGIKIWNPEFKKVDSEISASNPDLITTKFIQPFVIVYSLDKSFRVLDANGDLIWAQMFSSGVACIVIGDTNNDGNEEIVAGGNDGTVRIFEGNTGKLLWFFEMGANVRSITTINHSIIIGGDNKKVIVLDGQTHKPVKELDFSSYIWFIKALKNPNSTKEIPKFLLISTYSFDYMGITQDDPQIPEVFIMSYPELETIIKWDSINIQDLHVFPSKLMTEEDHEEDHEEKIREEINEEIKEENPPLGILLGDTDGSLILKRLKGEKTKEVFNEKLPSLINTVIGLKYELPGHSTEMIFFAGCDNCKIYCIKILKKSKI
jgi:hypothetical protein